MIYSTTSDRILKNKDMSEDASRHFRRENWGSKFNTLLEKSNTTYLLLFFADITTRTLRCDRCVTTSVARDCSAICAAEEATTERRYARVWKRESTSKQERAGVRGSTRDSHYRTYRIYGWRYIPATLRLTKSINQLLLQINTSRVSSRKLIRTCLFLKFLVCFLILTNLKLSLAYQEKICFKRAAIFFTKRAYNWKSAFYISHVFFTSSCTFAIILNGKSDN